MSVHDTVCNCDLVFVMSRAWHGPYAAITGNCQRSDCWDRDGTKKNYSDWRNSDEERVRSYYLKLLRK